MATPDHSYFERARRWLHSLDEYATCPITQGALVRLFVLNGATPAQALEALASVTGRPGHEFWPDDLGYEAVGFGGVVGHRQVTDAYLAGLARHHEGQLATFDKGLAALHPDVAFVVPRDTPANGQA